MKKLLFVALLLSGCATPALTPLKSNYEKPYMVEINRPFDDVWSDVVDVLATKGLNIKTLDKSSGIVISEKVSFVGSITVEDANGIPKDPKAYVVTSWNRNELNMIITPNQAFGTWNVRVKKLSDSVTVVSANIVGLEAVLSQTSLANTPILATFEAKSTGVFEKSFLELIKK